LRFPEFSGEWKENKIIDVAPLQRGFDLPNQDIKNGDVPIVYSNGILKYHNEYRCEAPGVITGRSGTIGNFTYIESGYYWPHNTSLWVTDFAGNDPRFVYYLYQTIRIEQYATGSGVPTLNRNDVHRHKVSIPSSILEQHKIATFLTLIDKRIATQRKVIERLETLINGINDRLHERYANSIESSFDELGYDYNGLSGKTADDFGNGKPYIPYVNVNKNAVVCTDNLPLVEIDSDEAQNKVMWGDIIFTLSSETPEEVAIGAVYLGDIKDLYLNSFCFGIRIADNVRVYKPYMAYFVSSRMFRRFVFPLAQGSTRYNLHKADFMKKRFLLPSYKNQVKISNLLTTYNAKIKAERQLLEELCIQKTILLSKLFI
jgi:type I restriction enzyme S subunit